MKYPPELEFMRQNLPELPWDKKKRYMQDYGLTSLQANILLYHPEYEDFFVRTVRVFKKAGGDTEESTQIAINYFFNNILGFLHKTNKQTK